MIPTVFYFLSIWEQPHPHSLPLLPGIQLQISQLHKEPTVWKCWECCWVGEHSRLQQVSFCYQRRKPQVFVKSTTRMGTLCCCLFISETYRFWQSGRDKGHQPWCQPAQPGSHQKIQPLMLPQPLSATSCHLYLFAHRHQILSACQFFHSLLPNF